MKQENVIRKWLLELLAKLEEIEVVSATRNEEGSKVNIIVEFGKHKTWEEV